MMVTLIHILFLLCSTDAYAQIAMQHSQSFDGARIQMLNGHREAALNILKDLYASKKDTKTQVLIESYSTQFLNKDSESLFYDSINFIGFRKFAEAKEKLDQANTKDPANVLILLRLAQVERELNLLEPAEEHIKAAIKLNPFQRDLKIMQALISINQKDDEEAAALLEPHMAYLKGKLTLLFEYLPLLRRIGKLIEADAIKKRLLSDKKPRILQTVFLLSHETLGPEEKKIHAEFLQKCMRESEKCIESIEQEMKRDQYLWIPIRDVRALLKKLNSTGVASG